MNLGWCLVLSVRSRGSGRVLRSLSLPRRSVQRSPKGQGSLGRIGCSGTPWSPMLLNVGGGGVVLR